MKRRHRCHRRRRGRRHHHRPRHRHRSVPGSRLRVIFTNRWLRRNLENEAGKPYWGAAVPDRRGKDEERGKSRGRRRGADLPRPRRVAGQRGEAVVREGKSG